MPNNTKANRRTMAFIYHMRRSAVSAGRQAGRPDKGNHLESGGISLQIKSQVQNDKL